MFSLQILYLAFIYSISLNQLLIRTRSLYRALYLLYARLKRVIRLSIRLIKLRGQQTPTQPAPRAARSLSAISRIAAQVGENLRRLRLSIQLIITFSSSLVSFFKLGQQSRQVGVTRGIGLYFSILVRTKVGEYYVSVP